MYSSDELKEALLFEGSFADYWWKLEGQTRRIRMSDVVFNGHHIPTFLTATVVEIYGTPSYDSYGYLSEGGYSAGIVFEIDGEYWKVEGHGDSYRVYFGSWMNPDDETEATLRKVTKKTRTVSDYV